MFTYFVRSYLAMFMVLPSFGVERQIDDFNDDVIVGARCRLRCLSLLQTQIRGTEQSGTVSLSVCKENDMCSWCIRPCDRPLLNINLCRDSCAYSAGVKSCLESCHFLLQVNSIRPGTCPPEMQATGTAARCINSCNNDADCDRRLRCCSNGCGWTCQQPSHTQDGMPEIPEVPETVENTDADSVTVTWHSVVTNASGLVLYLVESRFYIGKLLDEGHTWSPWTQAAQTTESTLVVSRLRPGHWYQFRIFTINIYGTRGPSPTSIPYKSPKEPSRPNPPVNLTEGDTIIVNGQIAVSINWSPPVYSDLPVTRYKLYWSKRSKGQLLTLPSSQEFRQVLSAENLGFQLTDLESDATYLVQVQAISQFGEVRLKSDRSLIYITTAPLNMASDQRVGYSSDPIILSRPGVVTPSSLSSLFVDSVYYQNGLLRANVSWDLHRADDLNSGAEQYVVHWSPEACATDAEEGVLPIMSSTTYMNSFIIYDLRFDCRYLVRVQPISAEGVMGTVAHVSISTPFCDQVFVVGDVWPDCPQNAPRIADEPPDLGHSFIITSTNITCKLSWGVPSSDVPITGYQVIWGQVLASSHFLLMDKTTAVSKLLPKDVRVWNIGGLLEATTYIVRVQAISRAGMGRVSSVQFTTPHLQMAPANPSYKEVTISDVVPRLFTKKRHNINIAFTNVVTIRIQPPTELTTPASQISSSVDMWFDQFLPLATSRSCARILQTSGLQLLLFSCITVRLL